MSDHTTAANPDSRRPWILPLLASAAAVAVAVAWQVDPDINPYGPADAVNSGINHLIAPEVTAVLLLTSGVLGLGLAGAALRGGMTRAGRRTVLAGAAAQAAFFAFIMADASIVSSLGYIVALAAPIGFAALLVLVSRAWRPVGVVIAVLVPALAAAGIATGVLADLGGTVTTYLGNVADGFRTFGPRIAWSWGMASGAAGWAWAVFRSLPHHSSIHPVRRWGRIVTLVAALSLVPYGSLRLTWLTPWPLGGNDSFVMHDLDPSIRLQGLLFAGACAVGVILTLGLISRWGEIFPRWVPVLGGRPVPVKLAVIPGGFVAAVITISAPGMLVAPFQSGGLGRALLWLVVFPFPVWGPALGAAVLAYWLRRSGAERIREPLPAHEGGLAGGPGEGEPDPDHVPAALEQPVRILEVDLGPARH